MILPLVIFKPILLYPSAFLSIARLAITPVDDHAVLFKNNEKVRFHLQLTCAVEVGPCVQLSEHTVMYLT